MSDVTINVRLAPASCWACGCDIEIISSIEFSSAAERAECSISDFTAYPQLIEPLSRKLASSQQLGPLKERFSSTMDRSYMSNGCAHCDAIFGQHYEIHTRYQERSAVTFVEPGTTDWANMMRDLLVSEDGHLH